MEEDKEKMTQAPVASGACRFITARGVRCQRRVKPDEAHCWQHSRGLRRRWHSLTHSQTVVFVIAVVSLVLGIPPAYRWISAYLYKPGVNVSLALITTISRIRDKSGGYMRGGQNDLVAVLRIRQSNGNAERHVQSLQVVGDVSADCQSYVDAFYPNLHGEYGEDYLDGECTKHKPFYHLSWTVFRQVRIGFPDDEEFVRFLVTQSLSATSFTGDPRKYFGFGDTNTRPEYPQTSPVWSLLVRFSGTSPDLTGYGPVLRDEVKSGKVKIQVVVDDKVLDIPVKEIKFPWAISWGQLEIKQISDQDLFYGIDRGERTSLPAPTDPLIKQQ